MAESSRDVSKRLSGPRTPRNSGINVPLASPDSLAFIFTLTILQSTVDLFELRHRPLAVSGQLGAWDHLQIANSLERRVDRDV